MTTVFSTLLQAAPNAGVMQIVILAFIIGLVVLIFRITKRKPSIGVESHINSPEGEKTISNTDIRIAGFELMSAGKSLIGAIITLFCAIPVNLILGYLINIYNTSYVDPYKATTPIPMMNILYFIYAIIALVAFIKLINGYKHIKSAGERLLKLDK
jgi:uncharacterized protein with PQ loop repeat